MAAAATTPAKESPPPGRYPRAFGGVALAKACFFTYVFTVFRESERTVFLDSGARFDVLRCLLSDTWLKESW